MEEQKTQTQPAAPSSGSKQNTGMAIVAYLLFFVPLLTDSKNDPFVKYHVKQSLMIFLVGIASGVVNVIPVLGQIVWAVCMIALPVLWIIGLINASKGEMKPLPLIGKYAEEWLKF
jgi:uncharacterized membrane protein